MNNIEWKDGAVCFADGQQWFSSEEIYLASGCGLCIYTHKDIINCDDFQLNEPRQGDYISKSELDTEQKYNDAVDEFGLFGCAWVESACEKYGAFRDGKILIWSDGLHQASDFHNGKKRKLTYSQLMAIGKLKRLMNKREDAENTIQQAVKSTINAELDKPVNSELKDGDKYIRTIYGLCGTPVKVDVYRVSDAFPTGSAPIDHAVKKMLCAGLRGHKDKLTDIDNAIESLQAARLLLIQKGEE